MNYFRNALIFTGKNILKILLLLCIIIIVLYTFINLFYEHRSPESESENRSFLKDDELISPSGTEKDEDVSMKDKLNYNSFQMLYYVDNMFLDWKNVFDYFIYNFNSDSAFFTEENNDEIVSANIKKLKSEFSRGNVEELAKEYGELIKKECNIYNLDWRLVLAIIRQESYFNPVAVSRAGAFGLMQLMPGTGNSLQNLLRLEDTKTPQNNLIAGIYYFATLVADFQFTGEDKYAFALSAYNAGLGRTIDVMTITNYFGDDYKKWDIVKENLKYLSSNYDSLHSLIWTGSKRPAYGHLNNWQEPYHYVDNVLKYYEEYKKYFETNLEEVKNKIKGKSKKQKKNKNS